MIINHNLSSLNANRQIGINATNANKSMEKLSSGLRINKAGDDAAGLAISEKMRGQIRGLDQASANSQDAISMIQTAEGALNETHSILQRMRELAVQSATDTNTADDRAKIQSEVDELAKEITRISNTTEFNTQNLMAGGLNNTFQIGANKDQNINLKITAMDAKTLGVAGNEVTTTFAGTNTKVATVSNAAEGLNGYVIKTSVATAAITAGAASTAFDAGRSDATSGAATVTGTYSGASDKTFVLKIGSVNASNEVQALSFSTDGGASFSNAVSLGAGAFQLSDGLSVDIADVAGNTSGDTYTAKLTAAYKEIGLYQSDATTLVGTSTTKVYSNMSGASLGNAATGLTVDVKFDYATLASTAVNDAISQTVNQSTAATIGPNGTVSTQADTKAGIKVNTQTSANLAIEKVNAAITKVSEERSKLGAYQNRLEHTIANLGTSSENLTSAESRIRDVNMAKEMSTFSKNNILSQAAQAMLAQANQQPQQVLQLLR